MVAVTGFPGDERVATTPEARVVAGALACIARWGVAKTTLDDIAREAGCSRATVYRLVPGGKGSLVQLVGQHEVARLLVLVTSRLDEASDIEEMLVEAISTASAFVAHHDALQNLLRHEPEMLLPFLAFDRLGPILDATTAFLTPYFSRHLDPGPAGEVIEWAARLVLSYSFTPSPTIDLTDPVDVGRLVRTYLVPGALLAAIEPLSESLN
jgi:AcrR family transcriptional regulator